MPTQKPAWRCNAMLWFRNVNAALAHPLRIGNDAGSERGASRGCPHTPPGLNADCRDFGFLPQQQGEPAHLSPSSLRLPIMRALSKNPDSMAFLFFTALFAVVIAHVGR
jgi:hypothetical protein